MGCGASGATMTKGHVVRKSETSMKAAMLIQLWYRRYLAHLEARRRSAWTIFQSLEYAAEQDQLRLYNFFNDMIVHLNENNGIKLSNLPAYQRPRTVQTPDEEDQALYRDTDPASVALSSEYSGAHLKFPLTQAQLTCLIDSFKRKQLLHARYVLELLHATRRLLRTQPNVCHIATSASREVTVCGDLHGKLDDLFVVLQKNGMPAKHTAYVFNGDFVDRGAHSVEIACLLFAFLLVNPNDVIINRGNHEDHVMNLRYGFVKEIGAKYKHNASKVIRLFQDVFSWLPLATVIDKRVFVCHGGVSDTTDVEYLNSIDRPKYISALRPPSGEDGINVKEWKQVLDVLWSDPRSKYGCSPNTFRGGGSYFGPDVTSNFLDNNGYELLIRSHECKAEGYEYDHNKSVLTIFSASNYYEVGSNKGAYVKLSQNGQPRIVQYMFTKHPGRKITIKQRVTVGEEAALRTLKMKIYGNKSLLLEQFRKHDTENTGFMNPVDWSVVMSTVLNVDLPWISLKDKLVLSSDNGFVDYNSTFEDFMIQNKYNGTTEDSQQTVTETLYRYRANLETIFRAIDKDNSGEISLEEFADACDILSKHTNSPISREHVENMVHNMDTNRDGQIDFNEFLEAFRIVDHVGREFCARRASIESLDDVDRS